MSDSPRVLSSAFQTSAGIVFALKSRSSNSALPRMVVATGGDDAARTVAPYMATPAATMPSVQNHFDLMFFSSFLGRLRLLGRGVVVVGEVVERQSELSEDASDRSAGTAVRVTGGIGQRVRANPAVGVAGVVDEARQLVWSLRLERLHAPELVGRRAGG